MIIALAFLLFAINTVIFVVTGDWLNGVFAVAFAIAWGSLMVRQANRKMDRFIQEAAPRPAYDVEEPDPYATRPDGTES